MNILQVISKLDSGERSRDVLSLTRFLTLNGHKVIVASPKSEFVKEIDQVGARHYKVGLGGNILMIPVCVLRLVDIARRENIQVLHSRDGFSAFAAFFAARFTGKVFISSVYENAKGNFFNKSQFWAKRVILLSASQARALTKDSSILKRKISIVPPAVDRDSLKFEISKENNPALQKAGSLKGYFVIGAFFLPEEGIAGNFIQTISALSRSVSRLKVFITDEPFLRYKDAKEKLKLLIKRHLLDSVVTFLPQSEYRRMMPMFDLFFQLNTENKISARLLLEAQAQGVPVLTDYAEWIDDYARDNETAIITKGQSPKDVAAKIIDFQKDGKLKNEIAQKAKDQINEKFHIKKIMESTLNIYTEASNTLNILIIKIAALGDVILSVPSIRAIREKFPNAKIAVLTDISNRDLFRDSPLVDEIIVCDFKERDSGFKGFLRVAKNLRSEDFDIAVDLQNNKKSHILSFLSCAPKRYGYDNGKLSFLLNRKIKDNKNPINPIDHQARVLGLLGAYNIDKKLELWYSKEDESWVSDFLKSHWIKEDSKLIAVSIGSSPRWVTKLWSVEYYVELCNRLAKNFGIRVILIGSEKTGARAENFLKRTKCKPINALGKTSIPRLAALVRKCDLLLGSDSAPIHVAASVGTPVVSFFGPTDPRRHLAPESKNVVLKKDLKCSPCYRTRCEKGYACMTSIKPDEVYKVILETLKLKDKVLKFNV